MRDGELEIWSTSAFKLKALEALKAPGQPLEKATLILFSNHASQGDGQKISDLKICTFEGYANYPGVVFGSPYISKSGSVRMSASTIQFIATGTPDETVFGWALVSPDLTKVWLVAAFDECIPLTEAGEGFVVNPVVAYGQM